MARQRTAWEDLSPAYRRRLEGAGITQASHATGARLNKARGHSLPAGAPNSALRRAAASGNFGPGQRQELERWRRTKAPKWLGESADLGNEAAALLAMLPAPKNWHDVEFVEIASTGEVELVVILKNGNGGPGERRTVTLPDVQAGSQVADRLRRGKFHGLDVTFSYEKTAPMNNENNNKPTKQPAKKVAAKKAPAKKKAPVKKTPAKKKAPVKKTPAKKKAPAKKVAKKVVKKKAPAKKTTKVTRA